MNSSHRVVRVLSTGGFASTNLIHRRGRLRGELGPGLRNRLEFEFPTEKDGLVREVVEFSASR